MKKLVMAALMVLGLMGAMAAPVVAKSDLCNDVASDPGLAAAAGCNTDKRAETAANEMIGVVTGVLGVVAVGIMIYGGVEFLISRGDAGKVQKARNALIYGAIGLVVVILAYAIVTFVSRQVL